MKLYRHNIDKVFASKQVSQELMELKGYKHIETFFVDSSGFGREDEAALTASTFIDKLGELIDKHGGVYASIIDAGMFQVYVGVFIKAGKSKAKKIANNTYRIEHDNGDVSIRLHNTDIIHYEHDGGIVLNNGGYETRTTKDRLNKYLPSGYQVFQKNYQWYLSTPSGQVEFENGMRICE